MGTRGLYIFYYQGKYYIMYNHNDSSYGDLGRKLLFELKSAYQQDRKLTSWRSKIKQLKSIVNDTLIKDKKLHSELIKKYSYQTQHGGKEMREVSMEDFNKLKAYKCPTDKDIKQLSKYTDLTISSRSNTDWYCLLRKCQGSFVRVLDAGYITYKIESSLKKIMRRNVCGSYMDIEYFYILDLDKSQFRYMSPQHDLIKFNEYFNHKLSPWHSIKLSNIKNTSKWPPMTPSPQDCIDEALKYQRYGNNGFKSNGCKFIKTIQAYKNSLKWVHEIEKFIPFDRKDEYKNREYGDSLKTVKKIYISVNFRLAVIYCKLNNWKYCIKHCSSVLKVDDNHLNALIKRAQCRIYQNVFESAMHDLKQATLIDKHGAQCQTIKKLMDTANNQCTNEDINNKKNRNKKKCDWCGVKGQRKKIFMKDSRNYRVVAWHKDVNEKEHSKPLRICSVCCDALYCSIKCQKLDWKKNHRAVCAKA